MQLTQTTYYFMLSSEIKLLEGELLPLSPQERLKAFYRIFPAEEVLYTCSFGSTAAYLLHLHYLEEIPVSVYFLETHYHFPETKIYRHELQKRMNLKVINVVPEAAEHAHTRKYQTWVTNADLCCSINKVKGLKRLQNHYSIWISGTMGWQNEQRKNNLRLLDIVDDKIKFYPLFDVSKDTVFTHLEKHQIPTHPLYKKGYESIGCEQCTAKGKGRSGRWAGQEKTECGLHFAKV